jgi:hypothetical protein
MRHPEQAGGDREPVVQHFRGERVAVACRWSLLLLSRLLSAQARSRPAVVSVRRPSPPSD